MCNRQQEPSKNPPVYIVLLCLLLSLTMATIALSGCGRQQEEPIVFYMDAQDFAGNQLENCTVEVEHPSSNSMLTFTYMGKEVASVKLSMGYNDWEAAGRPNDGVSYMYYCLYEASGEDCVYLYMNESETCTAIPLRDRDGEYLGAYLYLDRDGYYIRENSVTHDGRIVGWRESEIERHSDFYYEQAEELLASIDINYFARLSSPASDAQEGGQ